MLKSVKNILTKEVDIKEFLAMEIELTKLKKLLATEVQLKKFLVQEIDLSSLFSSKSQKILEATDDYTQGVSDISPNASLPATEPPKHLQRPKRYLPSYDYTLIDTLHDDHKKMRFVYNRLMSLAIEKDYTKVAKQLEVFTGDIRKHYQKADVNLYAYLKIYIKIKYPRREKSFALLSLDMKNISIEIFYTISQSPNIPLTEKTYTAFMKEFVTVGKLMNERINREKELLLKMYQETNKAKSIS